MEWINQILNFIIKMSIGIELIGYALEYPAYIVGLVEQLGKKSIQKMVKRKKGPHCKGCLCKNPVLVQILRNKMVTTIGNTTELPKEFEENENQEVLENLCTPLKNYRIDDHEEISGNYSQVFLQKCRDPEFLKNQLQKIEDEFQSKISKIQEHRKDEIMKHERHYKIVKNEILRDEWYQI